MISQALKASNSASMFGMLQDAKTTEASCMASAGCREDIKLVDTCREEIFVVFGTL